MAPRPSFYLILGIDPAENDWARIEQRLQDRHEQWCRDKAMGNPKARREAARNLDLLAEMQAVLKDPDSRRQEAARARKELDEERRQTLAALDRTIEMLKGAGGACSEGQLAKIVAAHGKVLARDEIERRIRSAGVHIGDATAAKGRGQRPVRPRLEDSVARAIQGSLEHLGLTSLYELLELKPNASLAALVDRAEAIYAENLHLGRTDAEATARNQLTGHCKRIFGDQAEKDRYDATLALAAMEELRTTIEVAGDDGFISVEEMNALVRQAIERGVSADDARGYIEELAAKRGWSVQPAAALEVESLRVCGACYAVADAGARACAQCGEPLELSCPRCGAVTPTANAACSSCGLGTGDAPVVRALDAEARRLLDAGELDGAEQALERALVYWPDWEPARQTLAQIAKQRAGRKDALEAVEQLIRERRMMAARAALDRLAQQHGRAGLKRLTDRVDAAVEAAERAYAGSEELRRKGQTEAALECLDQALAACLDHEPARQALASSPPAAPSDLRIVAIPSGLRLRWAGAPGSSRLGYRVLRKAGGRPHGAEDGDIVGEPADTFLDDVETPVGEPVHYAVYSVRSGVVSATAAHSGPHLRLAEVEALEAVAGAAEVRLRWRRPPGCSRVEVSRSTGQAPDKLEQGTRIPVTGESALDTGLANGTTYGYRVVACFPDPAGSGALVESQGRAVRATPVAPPEAVTDLTASRTGRSVRLRWTPVEDATVEIRQAAEAPAVEPGQILAVDRLDQLGTPLSGGAPGSLCLELETQGRVVLVPVSIRAGTAVVGRACMVTTLDPVRGLSCRRSGRRLELTWTWPAGLDEVVLCCDHDRFPADPASSSGRRVRISRAEYERRGAWVLELAEPRRHYFSVFSVVSGRPAGAPGSQGSGADGSTADELWSEPAQVVATMGQAVTVAYRVVTHKALLSRRLERAWIELECNDPECGLLPALVVVGKPGSVPVSPRDGRVLLEQPPLELPGGQARIPIPEQHLRGGIFVKLFFGDPSAAPDVRLLPARKDRLRVS